MFQKLRYAIVPFAVLTGHAATNITFFGISDPHYGKYSSSYFEESRQLMPTLLNTLPGRTYPIEVGGGIVDTPRAVLIAGDLVDYIDTALWRAYTEDYGVSGEKRLRFPTFEAIGNHDFYATGALKDTLYAVKSMVERNNERRPYLTSMDSAGYHYSWDWDGVHFVNLNVYAGDKDVGYHGYRPMGAIRFLEKDLAENVGESGNPVFIMQHFGVDSFSNTYWSAAMRGQLYNILKNYNVIGILHGHTHKRSIYKWNGIDVFDAGTVMEMDALVFHITDGHMRVANRIHTGWGKNFFSKAISMGMGRTPDSDTSSPPPRVDAGSLPKNDVTPPPPPTALRSHKTFSVSDVGFAQKIPADVTGLEILNLRGARINLIRVSGSHVVWDRLDKNGAHVPEGVYLVRDANRKTLLGKFIVK